MNRKNKTGLVNEVMKMCNSFFVEVTEYNDTFLSKLLLSIWAIMGTIITVFTYIVTFSDIHPIMRLAVSYCDVIGVVIFLNMILSASSVNQQIFKLSGNVRRFMIGVTESRKLNRTFKCKITLKVKKI